MTRPGIEPRSPGPLANTLLIRPMVWLHYIGRTNPRLNARIEYVLMKIQNLNVDLTDNLKNTVGFSIAEHLLKKP